MCMSVSKEHKEVFQISFYLYCTLTKEKRNIYRKKMQYTITSKKGEYTYNILSIEIISTDKLHSDHFISCVLKYSGKCFKWQLTHSTNAIYTGHGVTYSLSCCN